MEEKLNLIYHLFLEHKHFRVNPFEGKTKIRLAFKKLQLIGIYIIK